MTNPTAAPSPQQAVAEPLTALKRAMQTLCDNVKRRQGAEQVREGIQRAMFDLQTVHMALSSGGCALCGWSRGHDYGCPNDPLNPSPLATQAVSEPPAGVAVGEPRLSQHVRMERALGGTIAEMRKAISDKLYNHGDAILCWVNEGDFISNEMRAHGIATPTHQAAECIGTQIARAEFDKRWDEAAIRKDMVDEAVTPEFLTWLQDQAPREGVASNVAWNAGVAWARSPHQAAEPAASERIALLETALTEVLEFQSAPEGPHIFDWGRWRRIRDNTPPFQRATPAQPQSAARGMVPSGLLKLARYGAAMLHWHRGDNPSECGDVDAITCQEEATRCGVLEGRNVNEPCCDQCICAPFVGWEVCYFVPDDVRAEIDTFDAAAPASPDQKEDQ